MKIINKLTLIIFIVVLSVCSVVSAIDTKFSRAFIKHFKDCNYYTETISTQFEDKTFETKRTIVGWRGLACLYKENIKSSSDIYNMTCSLPQPQVDEIYNAMKSKSKESKTYDLEVYGEKTNIKTGKKEIAVINSLPITGNPAYIAWAKYQNNPYFCKIEKVNKDTEKK